MAKANLKIYVDDIVVRNYGSSKSDIVNYIANLNSLSKEELVEEFPQLEHGEELRFSVINKKNRNRVYRFPEILDRLNKDNFAFLIQNNILRESVLNINFTKKGTRLEFSENCELLTPIENIEDLFHFYVTKEDLLKHSEMNILIEILRIYGLREDEYLVAKFTEIANKYKNNNGTVKFKYIPKEK